MDIGRHVPGIFTVGLDDLAVRIEGNKKYQQYFKTMKYPGQFHFFKGIGHEYPHKMHDSMHAFLLKKMRVTCPKKFTAGYRLYDNAKQDKPFVLDQYWLRARKWASGGAKIEIEVVGNTIKIVADNKFEGELFLNDQIVDLDKEITILSEQRKIFSGKVKRSIPFLLEHFRTHRDHERLFLVFSPGLAKLTFRSSPSSTIFWPDINGDSCIPKLMVAVS